MKQLTLLAVISLAVIGCTKSFTHRVGKTIGFPQEKAVTLQAVSRIVRSVDFKLAFIKDLPDKRVKENIESSEVIFNAWMSDDGKVMLDFDMPGYSDSDLDEIAKYLKDLVTTRLAAQHAASLDDDKPRR